MGVCWEIEFNRWGFFIWGRGKSSGEKYPLWGGNVILRCLSPHAGELKIPVVKILVIKLERGRDIHLCPQTWPNVGSATTVTHSNAWALTWRMPVRSLLTGICLELGGTALYMNLYEYVHCRESHQNIQGIFNWITILFVSGLFLVGLYRQWITTLLKALCHIQMTIPVLTSMLHQQLELKSKT